METFQIITLDKAKEFIEGLDKIRRARVDHYYYLFEIYGYRLPSRYLKKLTKDLWELRPGDVRLFITIRQDTAIVVHGIVKKTQKIPKKDLELAIQRIKSL